MGQINTRYAESQHVADETSIQHAGTLPADPLRFCIFTTIALIAWVLGPPLAVTLMSGLGLWAYIRAWRQGLRSSKCLLRDPRLVMLYLSTAFVAGLIFSVLTVLRMII